MSQKGVWFDNNSFLEIGNYTKDATYHKNLDSIKSLKDLVEKYSPEINGNDQYFLMELVLWALAINNKLDRTETEAAFTFENNELNKLFYGNN